MKHSDNLHQDYIPTHVVSHMKTSLVRGIIVLLRFKKTESLTKCQKILSKLKLYKCKDIYFWLPYKNVLEAGEKYSLAGPQSRYPFAKQWFEVKETSEIYKQGLNDFVFKQQLLYQHSHELRQTPPFLASELLTLTRKSVIKILDDFVFKRKQQQKK